MLCGCFFFLGCKTELGNNLESVDWLPEVATDINFSRTNGWFAYDCKMSEQDFLSWAKTENYYLNEIDSPQRILLYRWITEPNNKEHSHTVDRGLYFHSVRNKGGGGFSVLHDRALNRMYYHYQVN